MLRIDGMSPQSKKFFDEMRSKGRDYRVVGELANTDRIMRDTFWVGVYPGMTAPMIGFMVSTIHGAVGQAGK